MLIRTTIVFIPAEVIARTRHDTSYGLGLNHFESEPSRAYRKLPEQSLSLGALSTSSVRLYVYTGSEFGESQINESQREQSWYDITVDLNHPIII